MITERRDEDHSRKNENQGKPPAHANNPDAPPGQTKPRAGQDLPEMTGQSQKSQIAQYFRSQGRQPDDVIWELQGLQLRLRDLD